MLKSTMRRTMPVKAVARELLRRPDDARWSYEISRRIKENDNETIRHGSIGNILSAMETEGWLSSNWESKELVRGRPARRYYRITKSGKSKLTELSDLANAGVNQ